MVVFEWIDVGVVGVVAEEALMLVMLLWLSVAVNVIGVLIVERWVLLFPVMVVVVVGTGVAGADEAVVIMVNDLVVELLELPYVAAASVVVIVVAVLVVVVVVVAVGVLVVVVTAVVVILLVEVVVVLVVVLV